MEKAKSLITSIAIKVGWYAPTEIANIEQSNEKNVNDYIIPIENRISEKDISADFQIEGINNLLFGIYNRKINMTLVEEMKETTFEIYNEHKKIRYHTDPILAINRDSKDGFGVIIDGQHRLYAIRELVAANKLPENFQIRVNVMYIVNETNIVDLVRQVNKDAIPEISVRESNNEQLTKMLNNAAPDKGAFGIYRPRINNADFFEKIDKLKLYDKFTVQQIFTFLMKENAKITNDLHKASNGTITFKAFKEKHKCKDFSKKNCEKYISYPIVLGINKECTYFKNIR